MSAGGPPLSMLARALRPAERASIARRWARALKTGAACELPATAFVSLYERGRVIGCVGHADVRSALAAARLDPRFGGARASSSEATVQLSLLIRGRVVPTSDVPSAVTLGEEGLVAFDAAGAIRAVLLPDVAADGQRDAEAMLRALIEKAGASALDAIPRTMLVRRERFVVRPMPAPRARGLAQGAAAWLAKLVDEDGVVAHGIDARGGRVHRTGPFHLGRAAVVVEALAAHGGHPATVRRARAWLAAAIEQAGDGLPRTPAERAATLALAMRAGIDAREALLALARAESEALAAMPWHAAQVTVSLADATPAAVQAAALGAIDEGLFAPWSVLAADRLGDRGRARAGRAHLARAIPTRGPHAGGVRTRTAPEVALTALALEVLAPSRSHRAAAARALRFVVSHAFAHERDLAAALDPRLALGAFPLAPHADFLRCDATAHALIALLAARRAKIGPLR